MVDTRGAVVALARRAPGLLSAERFHGVPMEGHLLDLSGSSTGEDCRLSRSFGFPQVSNPRGPVSAGLCLPPPAFLCLGQHN